jgi:type I restriction enzyme S subunit
MSKNNFSHDERISIVDSVPTNWKSYCLQELGSFTNGINKEKTDFGFGTPFINLQDIFGKNAIADLPVGLVNAKNDEISRYGVRKNDVLFVRSSVKAEGVGLTAVVLIDKPDMVFSGFIIRFRPADGIFYGDFLKFCFYESHFRKSLLQKSTISANTNINQRALSSLKLHLPPYKEQIKISQILSTWDRAIERVQRLIHAKQRQKDRLVTQLLSGKIRCPGFQDEWKQVKLGAFLHPKFRKVVKPARAYLRLGIRSHGKGTFTSVVDDPETIALTHLFQARKDDLIVNITFAWEGAIALVGLDGDGALVSHRFPTYVFDTSRMLPEYFKHLMVTDRFFYELDLISPGGAGRNRVMNKRDFLKITVTIPGVEEQKKIASMLGGMDEQIVLLKKYLERLKEQKKGLMQKLLTGELRVKVD